MKYLFLLQGPDGPLSEPGTTEHREMFGQWNTATGAMAKAGVLIECGPLQPVTAATTVRVRDGETMLTDGPAAEIKEHFGGMTLVERADLDEALKWAQTLPTAADGSVEVRRWWRCSRRRRPRPSPGASRPLVACRREARQDDRGP